MKRIFIALVLCLVCASSIGQKTFSSENFVIETEDEWGDKTGEFKVGIQAKGYFSNSATTNSCAELIIHIMKDHSWFDLYEYCGNHASHDSFSITFIGLKTKKEVSTTDDIPTEFIKLCSENDTINVKLDEISSYGSTTAVFRLFNCKDFYRKYVEQFGEIPEEVEEPEIIAPPAPYIEEVVEVVEEEEEYDEEQIFIIVETMPEFPGGNSALMKFLAENTQYPVNAQEKGIQGRVICTFVVEKNGKPSNIQVVRTSGDPSLDKEAVRVISTMPKWKPGTQRGKPVRVTYTLPVSFRLQ
jgi:TonB family protein